MSQTFIVSHVLTCQTEDVSQTQEAAATAKVQTPPKEEWAVKVNT